MVGRIVISADVSTGEEGGVELKTVCSELPIGTSGMMLVGLGTNGVGRTIDKVGEPRIGETIGVLEGTSRMSEIFDTTLIIIPSTVVTAPDKTLLSLNCRGFSRRCRWCAKFGLTCSRI